MLRALRRRGHQEEADPVVLQDHRLRRPAAGRPEPAGGHLARPVVTGSATGSAGPTAPTSTSRSRAATSRSRSSRRAPTRCSARRSSWWRPTPPGGRAGAPTSSAQALRGLPREVRKAHRHRPAGDRPAEDRRLPGRHAINPVNGERLPIWAADYVLADYGTGAIMAVPAHDQRDLDFAGAFDLPVVAHRRSRAGPTPRARRAPATGRRSTRRQRRDRAGRAGRSTTAKRTIIELAGGRRAPARARSTTACATG